MPRRAKLKADGVAQVATSARIGNGKVERTPLQLERQEKCFDRSVDGLTIRAIAAELGIAPHTVMADIRHEEMRRSAELAERREYERSRSIAFYAKIARKAEKIAENPILPGDTARLAEAIKARERIDKIMGIDAPTKVDIGAQSFLDAINGAYGKGE